MLDSTPYFANWPPRPTEWLPLADFRAPSPNGVHPTWTGWVYVKVNAWDGTCKVGYTDGQIVDRLTETGAPYLALHAAFHITGGWARDAEDHCHNRLGRYRRIPFSMTGHESEFFPGPVDHITHLVAKALQEFLDHALHVLGQHVDVQTVRYDPAYDPRALRQHGLLEAPYWSRKLGLDAFRAPRSLPF